MSPSVVKSCLNVLLTTYFVGIVLSQASDNASKAHAADVSKSAQQSSGSAGLTPKQLQPLTPMPPSPSQLQSEYIKASQIYNSNPALVAAAAAAQGGDAGDAILVPVEFADEWGEREDGGSEEDDALLGEGVNSPDKRYRPRFVGKRYQPRFVGKRYQPRFVGKRYQPRFVGKRYQPRFVGKRYQPRFVGKRYQPRFVGKRFVGKREAEDTNEAVPHSVEKRAAPRFVGKRHSLFDALGLSSSWDEGSYDNDDLGYGDDGDSYDKRGAPRFVGKRGPPRFVGKRDPPRFVGKRGPPRFVGKRGPPRFVGKRGPPRFVGKRRIDLGGSGCSGSNSNINTNEDYNQRLKKSVYDQFAESELQSFLDEWSRQEALENDKRWSTPVTPGFIGKRMSYRVSDFER